MLLPLHVDVVHLLDSLPTSFDNKKITGVCCVVSLNTVRIFPTCLVILGMKSLTMLASSTYIPRCMYACCSLLHT